MFDITSSKLLILGIVALIVVGPKDLPMLLRTLGKYVGMIRRQAAEFRSQFDEAMRDSELADLKRDVENLGRETESVIRDAEQSVNKEISDAERDVKTALESTEPAAASVGHDPMNGLESHIATPETAPAPSGAAAENPAVAPPSAPAEPAPAKMGV